MDMTICHWFYPHDGSLCSQRSDIRFKFRNASTALCDHHHTLVRSLPDTWERVVVDYDEATTKILAQYSQADAA